MEMSHHCELSSDYFSCDKNAPEMFSCGYCDFETDLSRILSNHVTGLHRDEENEVENYTFSSYECGKCNIFRTFSALVMLRHVADGCGGTLKTPVVAIEKRYKCEERRKKIKKTTNLRKNVKWHKCDQCAYETNRYFVLKRHVQSMHTDERFIKRFECDRCPWKGKKKQSLREHVKLKHNPEEIEWFECGHCGRKFNRKGHLQSHIMHMHTKHEALKWYECGQCSYKFKSNSHLRGHITAKHLHDDEVKWFRCDQCPYKCKAKGKLKRHVNLRHLMGEDIKWFECEHCDFKTKIMYNLRRHVAVKHEK